MPRERTLDSPQVRLSFGMMPKSFAFAPQSTSMSTLLKSVSHHVLDATKTSSSSVSLALGISIDPYSPE